MREIKKQRYKRRINSLKLRVEELEEQHEATQDMMQMTADYLHSTQNKLQRANRHMSDSIQYAQRIQRAMLDSPAQVNQVFPKNFVLYEPKDVLSGDLYWFRRLMGLNYVAVVDCTGHGVPAAMLTVLALSLLNQVVISFGVTDPAEILGQLDVLLSQYTRDPMKQNQVKDGLDIVLCCHDAEQGELVVAGAHRPLYLIRDGELHQIKGARYSLGANDERSNLLKSQTIEVEKGDRLYLFSDGFPDQFGGAENRKYMVGKFKKLLLEVSDLPMEEQNRKLKTVFQEWRGEQTQTDDVLVVGVEI